MVPGDLLFLASVVVSLALTLSAAFRSRRRVCVRLLLLYITVYAVVLAVVAERTPRRYYAPGETRCYDDWCVAVSSASSTGNGAWTAIVRISSVARRVRQRAADAGAEMEDTSGNRYHPDSDELALGLRGYLDPGEAREVRLRFAMPAGRLPAGIVFHHGAFPGAIIIGNDASLLHEPALSRVNIAR